MKSVLMNICEGQKKEQVVCNSGSPRSVLQWNNNLKPRINAPTPCVSKERVVADVFISYSSENTRFAQDVVWSFEGNNLSVLYDRKIPATKEWPIVLSRDLAMSKVVLVLWSHFFINKFNYLRNTAKINYLCVK